MIVQIYRKTQNHQQQNYQKKGGWPRDGNESQRGGGRSDVVNAIPVGSTPSLVTPPVSPSPKRNDVGLKFTPTDALVEAIKALQTLAQEQQALPVGGRLKRFWRN